MKGGGPPYTMIDVGKGTGGGMQKKPNAGVPTSWLPYVQVDDVKKTMAKASKGGAKVLLDYMPIGEMGAIGVFSDPTGAMIGLWEEAKRAPKRAAKKSAAKKKAAAKPKKTATRRR
jgi:predicted enzyme related to lactoylglutathione lyase